MSTQAFGVELEDAGSPLHIAGYVEGLVIREREPLSRPEILKELALEDIQQSLVEDAFEVLSTRSGILGGRYHLEVDETVVRPRFNPQSAVYEAMCLMALRDVGFRHESQQTVVAALFDEIVAEIGPSHFGAGRGHARVIAKRLDERYADTLADRVREVVESLGSVFRPEVFDPDVNDGGVDVIVWNTYDHNALNNPVIVLQNTTALDYRKKPRDVVVRQWEQALGQSNLAAGFAVPFIVESKWQQSVTLATSHVWHLPVLVGLLAKAPDLSGELIAKCSTFVESQRTWSGVIPSRGRRRRVRS